MGKVKNIILDMDGVLYTGEKPIGNLPRIFDEIRKREINFILATNNATLSPINYVKKLKGFNVTISEDQVINSAEATIEYLINTCPTCKKIYMIGEDGLKDAIIGHNLTISDKEADAVVVGLDRHVTYEKLTIAFRFLLKGALFLGTNPDVTIPTTQGLAPGTGAIIQALEAAIEQKATIIGKPQPTLLQLAINKMKAKPEDTMIIGDRLETDILAGKAVHCQTALVLTGISRKEDIARTNIQPDIVAESLEDLIFHVLPK